MQIEEALICVRRASGVALSQMAKTSGATELDYPMPATSTALATILMVALTSRIVYLTLAFGGFASWLLRQQQFGFGRRDRLTQLELRSLLPRDRLARPSWNFNEQARR